jgi:antitoxin component YwqK of YwqJK toxin-antitoxin module
MTALINQTDPEGRSHGVWEDYYTDGTLWWRTHYRHGKEHGVREGYCKDGTLVLREQHLHGKRHGAWQYYTPGTHMTKPTTLKSNDHTH